MFDYDEDSRRSVEKLDEYNLKDILSSCYDAGIRDPYDIRNHIIKKHYPELEDYVMSLSEDEWMIYLTARYPVKFEEIVHYRMWYRR